MAWRGAKKKAITGAVDASCLELYYYYYYNYLRPLFSASLAQLAGGDEIETQGGWTSGWV